MKYKILDVSNWKTDFNHPGKGNREKYWLVDPINNNLAMFKVPRENRGEHWAEKLCCEFATVLGFQCAAVELAVKNGVIGSLSYSFANVEYGFSHYDGGHYVPSDYDDKNNYGYSWIFITDLLGKIEPKLIKEILYIMVFDALVGEGDRHQDNWGITRHETKPITFISPLYDNSASLGRDLTQKHLDTFANSKEKFLRYIYKSKSKVGWKDVRNERHFSLIKKLTILYPYEMKKLLYKLKVLTDIRTNELVELLPDELIDKQHKEFIKAYVKTRRDILIRIGDNMGKTYNNLLLVWKDPETRLRFTVGLLKHHENAYSFQYINPDLESAQERGFKNFPGFESLSHHYEAVDLFPVIKRRLPPASRPDYPFILEKNGLDYGCSDMELLEATRGRLTTDTFEFVGEFRYEGQKELNFTFDLAGARHYKVLELTDDLIIGDTVSFEQELDNEHDKNAVKIILDKNSRHIGYVPKYYSSKLVEFLKTQQDYVAFIKEIDFENDIPDEWIKIKLSIKQ